MKNDLKLELHPDASKNFIEKADALLFKLEPLYQSLTSSSRNSFSPNTFISHCIEDKDIIGDVRFAKIDQSGVEIAKCLNG
jgi:hypothetical protein